MDDGKKQVGIANIEEPWGNVARAGEYKFLEPGNKLNQLTGRLRSLFGSSEISSKTYQNQMRFFSRRLMAGVVKIKFVPGRDIYKNSHIHRI